MWWPLSWPVLIELAELIGLTGSADPTGRHSTVSVTITRTARRRLPNRVPASAASEPCRRARQRATGRSPGRAGGTPGLKIHAERRLQHRLGTDHQLPGLNELIRSGMSDRGEGLSKRWPNRHPRVAPARRNQHPDNNAAQSLRRVGRCQVRGPPVFCEHGVGGKESVVGEGNVRRGIRTQAQNRLSGRGEGLGEGREAGRVNSKRSPTA